jgi:hypothetical protein
VVPKTEIDVSVTADINLSWRFGSAVGVVDTVPTTKPKLVIVVLATFELAPCAYSWLIIAP